MDNRDFSGRAAKPDAVQPTVRFAAPLVPIHFPKLPSHLFPITSHEDLMDKLATLLRPRQSAPESGHAVPPAGRGDPRSAVEE